MGHQAAAVIQEHYVEETFPNKFDHISFRRYVHSHGKYVHGSVFLRSPENFDFDEAARAGLDPDDPDYDMKRIAHEKKIHQGCCFSTRSLLRTLSHLFEAGASVEAEDDKKVPEYSPEMLTDSVRSSFFESPASLADSLRQHDNYHKMAKVFLNDPIECITVRSSQIKDIPRFLQVGIFRVVGDFEEGLHAIEMGVTGLVRMLYGKAYAQHSFATNSTLSEQAKAELAAEQAEDDALEQTMFESCVSGEARHWYTMVQMKHFDLWMELVGNPGDEDADPGSLAFHKTTIVCCEIALRESHWKVDERGKLVRSKGDRCTSGESSPSAPIPIRELDFGVVMEVPCQFFAGLTGLGLMRLFGYYGLKADHYDIVSASCQSFPKWCFTKRIAIYDQANSCTPNHRWCPCDMTHPSHSRSMVCTCVICGVNRASFCANDSFMCQECIMNGHRPPPMSFLQLVEYDTADYWRTGDGRGKYVKIHQRLMSQMAFANLKQEEEKAQAGKVHVPLLRPAPPPRRRRRRDSDDDSGTEDEDEDGGLSVPARRMRFRQPSQLVRRRRFRDQLSSLSFIASLTPKDVEEEDPEESLSLLANVTQLNSSEPEPEPVADPEKPTTTTSDDIDAAGTVAAPSTTSNPLSAASIRNRLSRRPPPPPASARSRGRRRARGRRTVRSGATGRRPRGGRSRSRSRSRARRSPYAASVRSPRQRGRKRSRGTARAIRTRGRGRGRRGSRSRGPSRGRARARV